MSLVRYFDKYNLQEEFRKCNRDYFSLDGYQQILDYYDEYGFDTELDVVVICCDFSEESIEDIYENYSNIERIADTKNDEGEIDIDTFMDAINYYTYAVRLENGNVLYCQF